MAEKHTYHKAFLDLGYVHFPLYDRYYKEENYFVEGDTALRITKHSSRTSAVKKGESVKVTNVDMGGKALSSVYVGGTYVNPWEQKVQVEGSSMWYLASNFVKVKTMPTTLSIDVDRPTWVREFTEVVADGSTKATRNYIGEWKEFTSLYLAQLWTSKEISDSIRGENRYRQFSIVTEKSVARAKKPEIEFA